MWSKSGCIIEGSSIIDGKKFYRIRVPRAQKGRLLFKILYSKKETRGSKANFEFETNEQIYKKTKIQNGNAQISIESGEERGLALYCGPKRCIYAHRNLGRAQEIPKVSNSRKLLSMEGDSIWNVISPQEFFYTGFASSDCRDQKTVVHNFPNLDDILVREGDQGNSQISINILIHLLKKHGWLINMTKSFIEPSQHRTFVGGRFCTTLNLVIFPQERCDVIKEFIGQFVIRKQTPAREFLRLLGMMAACVELTFLARLHMRLIQMYLVCF